MAEENWTVRDNIFGEIYAKQNHKIQSKAAIHKGKGILLYCFCSSSRVFLMVLLWSRRHEFPFVIECIYPEAR